MSDDFDARVERWLRERGEVDPTTLRSVAGHVAMLPPRRRVRPGPWRAATAVAAAVVVVAVVSLGLVRLQRPGGALPTPLDSAVVETSTASTTQPTTATVQPTPTWVADLAGQLECDGAIPRIGGEVGEFGAGLVVPGANPDAALRALLEQRVFASLPARGFEPAQIDGHWARQEYLVGGRRKAVVVSSDDVESSQAKRWHVLGVRACDSSEFDPADGLSFDQTLWLDASNQPARSDVIHSSTGPEHCGLESVIFLRFDGVQYLRDPLGLLDGHTLEPFDPDAELPNDAVDSGYHTGTWRLFTVHDGDAVYVQEANGTFERWGRSSEEVGCA